MPTHSTSPPPPAPAPPPASPPAGERAGGRTVLGRATSLPVGASLAFPSEGPEGHPPSPTATPPPPAPPPSPAKLETTGDMDTSSHAPPPPPLEAPAAVRPTPGGGGGLTLSSSSSRGAADLPPGRAAASAVVSSAAPLRGADYRPAPLLPVGHPECPPLGNLSASLAEEAQSGGSAARRGDRSPTTPAGAPPNVAEVGWSSRKAEEGAAADGKGEAPAGSKRLAAGPSPAGAASVASGPVAVPVAENEGAGRQASGRVSASPPPSGHLGLASGGSSTASFQAACAVGGGGTGSGGGAGGGAGGGGDRGRLPLDTFGCIVGVKLSQAMYYFKNRAAALEALQHLARKQAESERLEATQAATQAAAQAATALSLQAAAEDFSLLRQSALHGAFGSASSFKTLGTFGTNHTGASSAGSGLSGLGSVEGNSSEGSLVTSSTEARGSPSGPALVDFPGESQLGHSEGSVASLESLDRNDPFHFTEPS
mmetsp:Transcript_69635/g.157425  ORF Transcript_69635/g.157425 Transcript_69635/m.157425 type:complete len:483 (+) Transcript_69635:569-2017(+)